MAYDFRDYIDDPELEKAMADFESGVDLDAKDQEAAQKNRLKTQKVTFQLALGNARNQRKLTQAELAEKLGVSQAAISKIENGNPSLEKLIQVADILGYKLTLSDIMKPAK